MREIVLILERNANRTAESRGPGFALGVQQRRRFGPFDGFGHARWFDQWLLAHQPDRGHNCRRRGFGYGRSAGHDDPCLKRRIGVVDPVINTAPPKGFVQVADSWDVTRELNSLGVQMIGSGRGSLNEVKGEGKDRVAVIKQSIDYAILTDILGDEDHLGDMDFKVAGTENGITSLQMDIKVAGITPEIMEKALAQAKDGRMHILGEMNKALSGAAEFSIHAPRIETMQIPTDKIREVIGSGGKVIREIVEVSGAKVDINDDGIIKIASPNGEAIQKAYDMIHSIVAEPEEGKVYTGKVVKIVDFGAFVNFFGKRDGLVHVSQIENRRLNHPSDVLKEGQEVKVKLLGFDDRGKVRLSMKVVDQETGEEVVAEKKEKSDD